MTSSNAPLTASGHDEPTRRAFADAVITEITRGVLETGTARLMLDVVGLTGDTLALAHAKAARYMRDGLRAGDINARDVDPSLTVGRDAAAEVLAAEYDREYQEAIGVLATVTPVQSPVPRPGWFDKFLDRFLLDGGMPTWERRQTYGFHDGDPQARDAALAQWNGPRA